LLFFTLRGGEGGALWEFLSPVVFCLGAQTSFPVPPFGLGVPFLLVWVFFQGEKAFRTPVFVEGGGGGGPRVFFFICF